MGKYLAAVGLGIGLCWIATQTEYGSKKMNDLKGLGKTLKDSLNKKLNPSVNAE